MTSRRPDYLLISLLAVLLAWGLMILASASVAVSYQQFGSTSHFIVNQLLSGVLVGGAGFLIAQRIPYGFWKKVSLPMLVLAILGLTAVFVPHIGFGSG